jgi:hypothetical protein
VIDNLETRRQRRIVFQPDDLQVPAFAALLHEVQGLRHFLAGVSSTIAVLLSPAGLTYLPESDVSRNRGRPSRIEIDHIGIMGPWIFQFDLGNPAGAGVLVPSFYLVVPFVRNLPGRSTHPNR